MKRLFLVINTLLILLVVGFTGLITLVFLIGDKLDYGIWVFVLVFSGLILIPLIIWRRKLKKTMLSSPILKNKNESLNRTDSDTSDHQIIMDNKSTNYTKPEEGKSENESDKNDFDDKPEMKVIFKSYYKDSSLLKEGEYVKPIPSSSSRREIDQFLLEKMKYESLGGNYTKTELEYIEKYLRGTDEYNENHTKSKGNNWKSILLVIPILSVVLFVLWKVFQMIPSWIFFLIGTYVVWSIVRPFVIGFLVKITGDNVMVRGKSLIECFQLRQMGNNIVNNVWVDWIVIPGILFSVLYINFSSGTNDFSGRLSERDVTGTYIFNVSDSERRQMIIASSGLLQVEDQELVLSRNRSYKLTSWSRNNGEITSKVNGTWILESLSDTVWKNGEVLKVRFSNSIKLDDGKVFHVSNDGNLHPYKTMISSIVWKRE